MNNNIPKPKKKSSNFGAFDFLNVGVTPQAEQFKEQRADVLAFYQQKLLNSLTDSDIKRMPPGSRLTGFGILYDKERLERGQSTDNIAVEALIEDLHNTQEQLDKVRERKAELLRLKAEQQGQNGSGIRKSEKA